MVLNWIELVIGFWILLSPWLLEYSDITIAKWSSIICGLILILVNVWILSVNKKTINHK